MAKRPRLQRLPLRIAGLAIAVALAPLICAQTLKAATLEIANWRLVLPSKKFASLPALRPSVKHSADNDLQSLVFVCDKDRFYALIVSPVFKYPSAATGILTLGEGGLKLSLAFRDLYGAPKQGAPKLEWDADILYAPVEPEDLSQIAPVKILALTLAGRTWQLPLLGFAKALPVFLTYCATGRITDHTVVAD